MSLASTGIDLLVPLVAVPVKLMKDRLLKRMDDGRSPLHHRWSYLILSITWDRHSRFRPVRLIDLDWRGDTIQLDIACNYVRDRACARWCSGTYFLELPNLTSATSATSRRAPMNATTPSFEVDL